MTDHYHEQMPILINRFHSVTDPAVSNNGISAPVPDTGLLNDQANAKIYMEPGKTYLVRMICWSNFAGVGIWFEGHNFTVVEVDGVYTEESEIGAKNLRIAPGQRWAMLVTARPDASANYAIFAILDVNMLIPPLGIPPHSFPSNITFYRFDFFDDWVLIPKDREPILEPDHVIVMDTGFKNINGIARSVINNVTYLPPRIPSLYTAATVGVNHSSNPEVYGQVNPFILKYGENVEIIVNNNHNNLHPWHVHGHDFQVIQRGDPNAGSFSGYWTNVSSTPMRRDTIMAMASPISVLGMTVSATK